MAKTENRFLLWLDRVLSQGLWSQLLLLAILMVAAFVFSNLILLLSPVDWADFCQDNHISRWVAPLYLLIDSNAFTSVRESSANGWTVFLACIIYIIGVFLFTGMMVSVMTNMIERRVEKHRNGLVSYLREGHYIIMGYDDTITSFIDHIFEKDPKAFVLVLTSVAAEKVHEKLLKSLPGEQLRHVLINYGHRTSTESYAKIHLETAREVFIVGYLGNQSHDAINVECVDAICRYLSQPDVKNHPARITCVFRDLDTYSAFKTTEIFSKVGDLGIEFVPHNYHAGWARQVLVNRFYRDNNQKGNTYNYPAVYRDGISAEDNHYVHLVFVGTTNFAVALASEAAHVLHFPNFIRDPRLKTRITFIEVNADREKDEFITRFRHFFEIQPYLYRDLSNPDRKGIPWPRVREEYLSKDVDAVRGEDYDFLDVEFEFIKGDIFSHKVQKLIGEWAKDTENQYLSLFIALSNHRTNFVMAMNLPDEVYDNAVPVFIRQARSDNFVSNLREVSLQKGKEPYNRYINGKYVEGERPSRYSNLFPFGMDETAYYSDDIHLRRAKLINYLYNTADYCSFRFKGPLALASIPDAQIWADADAYWKELSVAYKWSNLYSAYTIDTKLASLRAMRGLKPDERSRDQEVLLDDEVALMAEVEHNRWNMEKLLLGYSKPTAEEDAYNVKDNDWIEDKLRKNKKHFIHPDIRPFNKLNHIQEMDREFSRSLPWILKMTADK